LTLDQTGHAEVAGFDITYSTELGLIAARIDKDKE
jgi:hypothetical protein